MILISITEEQLADIVGKSIEEKLTPVMSYLGTRKIGSREAMEILNVKSPTTITKMVRDGRLTPCPDNLNGNHKFVLGDVLKLANNK